MRRILSVILSLALIADPLPAAAQALRAASVASSAPIPAVSSLAPLSAANAVSTLAPSLIAPGLGAAPSNPAPAPLPPAAPVLSRLVCAPAPRTALSALDAASAGGRRAAAAFDGGDEKPAGEPVVGESGASQPPLDPPDKPKKRTRPLYSALTSGALIGGYAAAAAPVLWGAAPASKLVSTGFTTSVILLIAVLSLDVALWIGRVLRRSPPTQPQPPPSWKRRLAMLALGAALAAGACALPIVYEGPLTDRYLAWNNAPFHPRDGSRRILGGAVEDETLKALSQNAVGREVLDHLRDRGGAVRLPTFFVHDTEDTYGSYDNLFDHVRLDSNQITKRGWTVEEFLGDPEKQRALIRSMQSTVLHELVHAMQARRAPWTAGYFVTAQEHEYEAFIYQHLYLHERLKADPTADLSARQDMDRYLDIVDDLDAYLAKLDLFPVYKNNPHVTSPVFEAFLAKQRALWPAHRAEVYVVMLERSLRQNDPEKAKMYRDKAMEAIAQLPEEAAPAVAP
ncbi:MAG: hypothetical protein HYZ74_09330 [Elusimicrobia bacterium]|nr:hypothetical protein [Elusimicrobiota bacterium]